MTFVGVWDPIDSRVRELCNYFLLCKRYVKYYVKVPEFNKCQKKEKLTVSVFHYSG